MDSTNKAKTLKQEYFGQLSRYCLITFQDRFGNICYFVKDANNCDSMGFSKMVYHTNNRQDALSHFGFEEFIGWGIIESKDDRSE